MRNYPWLNVPLPHRGIKTKEKGEINSSECQLWVNSRGVVYSSAAEPFLWCRDTHLSSIRGSVSPLCSSHLIPWELSYVISKATSKVIGKIPHGNKSSGTQKCKKKKTKQVRSSAENLPDLLRWVLMIIERLVWLSADSVQARLHCAPSAFQSHLNSCQCLIIPPFPS